MIALPGRFIRIEVEKGAPVHQACDRYRPLKGDRIEFGGPVLWDRDLPSPFLELHPLDTLTITPAVAVSPSTAAIPTEHVVVAGDYLARIAEKYYGRQLWQRLFRANRQIVRNADLIQPGWHLTLPLN